VIEPLQPGEPDYTKTSVAMTDADLRHTMLSAIRLLAVLCVVVMVLFWWRSGWQSAILVLVGAAISMASLWEYLRLTAAMNRQMDGGSNPRPGGLILFGFVTRLGLTIVVLYVSLKYLHGTAFALAAGLGLGVVSLTFEALRLMKKWSA